MYICMFGWLWNPGRPGSRKPVLVELNQFHTYYLFCLCQSSTVKLWVVLEHGVFDVIIYVHDALLHTGCYEFGRLQVGTEFNTVAVRLCQRCGLIIH